MTTSLTSICWPKVAALNDPPVPRCVIRVRQKRQPTNDHSDRHGETSHVSVELVHNIHNSFCQCVSIWSFKVAKPSVLVRIFDPSDLCLYGSISML